MTRQDYIMIARVVRETLENIPTVGTWTHETQIECDMWSSYRNGVKQLTQRLAEEMKRDNPRFRYDKFFEACGLDGWGE